MAAKKIILFIDDSPVDRKLVSNLLKKYDFDVLLAEDGSMGLRMAQDCKVDIILLDILLPGISGIGLCKELKKIPATKDIPVIFYTSLETPKEVIDYASCGAQDYIQKNISPEDLITAIKSHLK
jgi:DNA-binding response OmpR family regulator